MSALSVSGSRSGNWIRLMMRIALGLEYDGTNFHGWQSQSDGKTVQDALEHALGIVASLPVRVHCAGRTDTGVHALGQVVHFDAPCARPLSAWVRGTNAILPKAVVVRWASEVSDAFHARFSARARAYRYLLLNRGQRPGLNASRVGWHHRPLDECAIREALKHLLGTHDFSAFRAAQCQAKSPIRTLLRSEVSRVGDMLIFEFAADGFLHHMIRNIVGAAVEVGSGKAEIGLLSDLLLLGDRRLSPPTFSPAGLYFSGAHYDAGWNLPQVGAGEAAVFC
jgi:tRNA pseudouridine38-40 synthase